MGNVIPISKYKSTFRELEERSETISLPDGSTRVVERQVTGDLMACQNWVEDSIYWFMIEAFDFDRAVKSGQSLASCVLYVQYNLKMEKKFLEAGFGQIWYGGGIIDPRDYL